MQLIDRQDLGALIIGILIPDMERDGIIPKDFNWKAMTEEDRKRIYEYVSKKIENVKEVRK